MTAPSEDARNTEVKRKIYFFRPDAGTDSDNQRIAINFVNALRTVRGREFTTTESGRYVSQNDGNVHCGWVDTPDDRGPDEIQRMRFAVIRKNALPQSESGGVLRDLLINDDEGICETSHVCFFPEGIIGVEFNFFGPRPHRLANYLIRVGETPIFTMEALLRQDMAEHLASKRALRRLTLRIRRSEIDQIAEADASLARSLRAAEQASDAECVGVILEPEPYKKANLRQSLLESARRILALPGARTNFREFQVSAVDADSPNVSVLNLLEDKLVGEAKILKQHPRTRVLDTDDAYAKIESTFVDLREELMSAMSVSIEGE